MKKILYCILSVFILISCEKEQTSIMSPSSDDVIQLKLNFKCDEMKATRSLSPSQEQSIKDINIFFFNERTGELIREYITSTNFFSENLTKGDYTIYTIANYGSNMGDMSKSEVENFMFSVSQESDLERNATLPMSAKQEINISSDETISIILTRLVAKVNVEINVSSVFDFTLNTVQVINVPQSCTTNNGNSTNTMFNYEQHSSSTFSFHLFENLQGVNNSISDERQKNKDNAPSGATYVHIIGSCESKKVEYSIYLGENNTTDFNVYRNKNYSYIININGINDMDNRVNIAALSLSPLNESYKVGDTATSTINLTCTENNSSKYSIAYYLLEGNGTVSINGTPQTEGVFKSFLNYGELTKDATLTYTQSSISKARIKIVAKDQSDFTFSREIFTNYIKPNDPLTITSVSSNESRGGSKSNVTFFAEKKDYNGTVQLKYELLSGTGTMKYKGVLLSGNTYATATLGSNSLEFTPSEPTDARVRITMKLADGETQTVETVIKVTRINVAAFAEGWRAGGEILFYVDNVQNGILPVGSCEKFETTKINYYRYMTYPYSNENEQDMSTEYEITRPNNKLKTAFDYFGQDEEEGNFTCYCHGYTYKYRYTTIEFKVYSPNKFYDFKFYYD